MKAKQSRRLVVDACVLQSAGETQHSLSCRDVLTTILEICHTVVMTPAIREEWKHHRSNIALKWWGSMRARKKIETLREAGVKNLSMPVGIGSESERKALQKDLHLVEAALRADGIIITREVELPALWEKYSQHFKSLRPIKWFDPTKDNIEDLKYL